MNRTLLATFAVALLGCGDNDTDARCDISGAACTWLGVPGQTGFMPDGQHRLNTVVFWTMDTLFARDGSVYFIDWNSHAVRRVVNDYVETIVGWTDPPIPGDGDLADPMAERSPDGDLGTNIQLNHPTDLLELSDGGILFMAWHNHKLRTIDPSNMHVRVYAGSGPGFAGDNGPVGAALFKTPIRIAKDEHDNMYIVDQQNQRIRRVDGKTQVITTIAGDGKQGYIGDGGLASQAEINLQQGSNPEPGGGIAYRDNVLYISDTDNNCIRAIDLATGIINTIAGDGEPGYHGNNIPAVEAKLFHPHDLEIGPDGDLYVADTDNNLVRAISLRDGTIRNVVGTGLGGYDGLEEGRPALHTRLNRPFGIDFDPQGNLYVSDSLNSRILRVAR